MQNWILALVFEKNAILLPKIFAENFFPPKIAENR
jgi:hypothetical protein